MTDYVVLLRGINVGGKNTVSMPALKSCLEELGFTNVVTYINSGNVILSSDKSAANIKAVVEELLPKSFKLDTDLLKVLVLTHYQLEEIVASKPKGFGAEPAKYHSDAIFLMDLSADEALKVFDPRDGVDKVWPGDGVIYSQRLSAERTKSRLNKIMSSPLYKSMTIRNWNTTTKLLKMLENRH